ncbi:MAG: hypothetical protein FD143_188 [Ignavibacteria bacterium]|nr:MAG: hypothetical protein FD143_188 [Ignavibacteria bacterium]
MIKKYLTFEEARNDLWVMKPNEEYYKRLRSLEDWRKSVTSYK